MSIKKDFTDPQLLEFAHPSQIEKKFGGDAENVTEFWPPLCPSNEYGHDPDCIYEVEEVVAERVSREGNESQE